MRIWFGIRKPKKPILGTELAGEIEAVGKDVKRFESGDQVYGYTGMNLGAYSVGNTITSSDFRIYRLRPYHRQYTSSPSRVWPIVASSR